MRWFRTACISLLLAAIGDGGCSDFRTGPLASSLPGDSQSSPEAGTADASDASDASQVVGDAGDASTGGIELVVSGQFANALAVDETNLYWAGSGNSHIVQCSKTSCVTPAQVTPQVVTMSLVVDSSNVYWINLTTGHLESCPLGGCTQVHVVESGPASALARDATHLYWGAAPLELHACVLPCDGTTNAPYKVGSTTGSMQALAADQGQVFWEDGDGFLYACSATSCTPGQIAPFGGLGFSAAVGQLAFAGMSGDVKACAESTCAPTVVGHSSHPVSVLGDGTFVYWRDTDTPLDLYRCPSTGCVGTTKPYAVIPAAQQGCPTCAMVSDDTYVYWTGTNQILKIRK